MADEYRMIPSANKKNIQISLQVDDQMVNMFDIHGGFYLAKKPDPLPSAQQPISVRAKILADKIMSSMQLRRLDIPQENLEKLYQSNIEPQSEPAKYSIAPLIETPVKVKARRDRDRDREQPSTKSQTLRRTPEHNSQEYQLPKHNKRSQIMSLFNRLKSKSSTPHINEDALQQLFDIFSELMRSQDERHRSPPASSIPKQGKLLHRVKDPIQRCLQRDILQRNILGVRSLSTLTKSIKIQQRATRSNERIPPPRTQGVAAHLLKPTQSSKLKQSIKKPPNIKMHHKVQPRKIREVTVGLRDLERRITSPFVPLASY